MDRQLSTASPAAAGSVATDSPPPAGVRWPGAAGALLVAGLLVALASGLNAQPAGRDLTLALGLGTALGVVLQRSRFCFFCHARDHFEPGAQGPDPRGLLAILLALAVGTVGLHLVYAGWVPTPAPGRLPADAHIGPVSWVLVLAGLAFGLGMVVSGSCISAHWYRLAEGSPTAPFALLGAVLGFGLGFKTWNALYSAAVAQAPVLWLPHTLGHAGSAGASLCALLALAWWWSRKGLPAPAAPPVAPAHGRALLARAFGPERWPAWIGGLAVGWIATLVVLRLRPLGVTAALGGSAREAGTAQGWVPQRLDGLDQLGGCATAFDVAPWLTPNAQLVIGMVGGAFVAALLSAQCRPRWPRWQHAARGLGGGVLLGWGAMTGLGCTVGTLMSGVMAGAVSGWVFGAAMLAAVWLGLRLRWAAPR